MRHVARIAIPVPLALSVLLAAPLSAQEHEHPSPYVGLEGRDIKALSEEDVRGLLEGEGMGYALAAELNGFPGPRHVLELADALGLDPGQLAETRAVRERMSAEARRLGAMLVDEERELDEAFATGGITPAALAEGTARIGSLEAELRRVHLAAHLEIAALLSEHQRHRYQELRGYRTAPAHGSASGAR